MKTLDEKLTPSLDLLKRVLCETDYSDLSRIHDIILEIKNDTASSLAPSGHLYALYRATVGFSRTRALEELWGGLTQVNLVYQAAALDSAEISRIMTRIRDRLISSAGLVVNITCSREATAAALKGVRERFAVFGPPRPRNPLTANAFFAPQSTAQTAAPWAEVYSSASLQVGFAATALPAACYATVEQTAELVLAHELSTGALWERIRMKGGAYGVHAGPDPFEQLFTFSTYRDPDPLRSLGAFPAILQEIAATASDEDFLEKAIISIYGKETRPRTSAEKGITDFLRLLYGIDDVRRATRLRDLINATASSVTAAAIRLAARAPAAPAVILAGPALAEQAAAALGVGIFELPV
jgi:Zn-dependent M16 (insulinase) family peptidase